MIYFNKSIRIPSDLLGTNIITHYIPKYFPINHRSGEIAVITHMYKNPIMKIRKISIIYCVNLVDAQGRNPKSYISNPSPTLLPSVIPQLVSNYLFIYGSPQRRIIPSVDRVSRLLPSGEKTKSVGLSL